MASSSALFELIQGMSRTEKRYFARFASLHSGRIDSDYYRLFQYIGRMRRYDAEILRNEFGRHIEQLKQQLFGKILASLRLYHEAETADQQVWCAYRNGQLLRKKQIDRSAKREFQRAKTLLKEQALPSLELHVRAGEINAAIVSLEENELPEILQEFSERTQQLVRECMSDAVYMQHYVEIEILNRKFEGTRSEAELSLVTRFLNTPSLQDISNAKTERAELLFSFCNGLANYLRCEFALAAQHFDRAHAQLIRQPFLSEQDPVIGIRIIADRALACFHSGNRKRYSESMDELIAVKTGSEGLTAYVSDLITILELMDLNRERKHEEAVRRIRNLKRKGVSSVRSTMVSQQEIYFVFQEVTALWGCGDLRKASARIVEFIADRGKHIKEDAYITVRIVFLLLWFELNDEAIVQAELRSVRTILVKRKKFYQVERCLLRFVTRMMTTSGAKERKLLTKKLSAELHELKKIPFERNAFLYFDFQEWVRRL